MISRNQVKHSDIVSVVRLATFFALAERDEAEQKAERWQYGKVVVDALGKALSISTDSVTGQIASTLSPAGAYAIGQYFKNNDAQNRQDGGNRSGEGSTPHLIAHGLLSAAVSYATGESVETITASSITTMGAEKLAPALGKLLYDTEQAADLTVEQKQTISNVLGTVGVVAGVVTAQATGADSYETATSAVNVQGSVQNTVENNATLSVVFDANSTPVKGYGGEVGLFFTTGGNLDKFDAKNIDVGVNATRSSTVGFGAGAGISVNIIGEGRENIDGTSKTTTICAIIACGSIHTDSNNKFIGVGGSVGGSSKGGFVPGGSFTYSENETKSLTMKDIIDNFRKR